jgi:large subunit ribosomal protein L35
MPKMKTNSSAKKRFTLTGTGKVKCKHAFKRHILRKKTKVQKNRLGQNNLVDETQEKQVKNMLLA